MLNELTLAAMPAMKAASRPASAIPSAPLGRYFSISSGMASLYVPASPPAPKSGITATAIRPGTIVRTGKKIFGKAPISGVRSAADRFLADRAR